MRVMNKNKISRPQNQSEKQHQKGCKEIAKPYCKMSLFTSTT